jgi:hypothetical protein
MWGILLASSILRRSPNTLVRSSIIPLAQMQRLIFEQGRHLPPLGLLKAYLPTSTLNCKLKGEFMQHFA